MKVIQSNKKETQKRFLENPQRKALVRRRQRVQGIRNTNVQRGKHTSQSIHLTKHHHPPRYEPLTQWLSLRAEGDTGKKNITVVTVRGGHPTWAGLCLPLLSNTHQAPSLSPKLQQGLGVKLQRGMNFEEDSYHGYYLGVLKHSLAKS